ncbi:prepilin-type N-terminal cleavage/methylation domain-containing protein [Salicibibacter cibarius]|uniref:Prepilin-type N-terminal cleavage/methylation domain-containing protein n=1 Tax=Salicibibacter cibarius TaxID=2743000 RepID=A0A7T6Z2Z8_9BACI|nr:prepilin-type N-terminal cleavage/methylation domain-containing protein [Salicibibacter cibarius]QQK75892.1 prepilin-type N-terminal cleavage/methylation domain-containing protein [Salicibibacter cibarius]
MPRISPVNDRGFTLLEMVIAMFMFFAVIAVVPIFLQTVTSPGSDLSRNDQEIQTWFQEISKEAKYARDYAVEQNRLIITDIDGVERGYRRSGGNLIRSGKSGGHSVLQNIDGFHAQLVSDGVMITVDANEKQYKKRLRPTKAPEEEDIWIKREL